MSKTFDFKKRNVLLGASLAASVLAAGCSTVNVEKTKDLQRKKAEKADRILTSGMKVRDDDSLITVSQDYYIAEKPIRLNKRDLLPDFFYKKVPFSQPEAVYFQEMLSFVSDQFNVRIEFTGDASDYIKTFTESASEDTEDEETTAEDAIQDSDLAILEELMSSTDQRKTSPGLPGSMIHFSIKHEGDLVSLLDRLTGRVGLYWEWQDNQISIFRTKTETIKADINSITENFSARFSSSSGNNGIQTSSNMQVDYQETPGDDFESALSSFLTSEGSVSVMPGMNMIVVRDIPTQVKQVKDFVERVNTEATTQIAIRLDIITVTENETNDFGVGLDAIFSGSSEYGFEFVSQLTSAASPNLKLGFISPTGDFSGSDAILNALRENGMQTKHYTKFGQTSNGRSMPLVDERTRDYIASLRTETDENGATSTDTEIETAVTGVDINVLPKMTSRNKVSMDIKFSISELGDLEERNFDGNTLQLPTKSNKSTTLSPVLVPGKTYMIGGTINEEEKSSDASITGDHTPFSWLLGGRKESSTTRVQTILLVTPYVVSS